MVFGLWFPIPHMTLSKERIMLFAEVSKHSLVRFLDGLLGAGLTRLDVD